jgi:hypothetical protein
VYFEIIINLSDVYSWYNILGPKTNYNSQAQGQGVVLVGTKNVNKTPQLQCGNVRDLPLDFTSIFLSLPLATTLNFHPTCSPST